MNKKFLSAILFGALMVGSAGTFTSCKDYDDDIDGLQKQIDATNVTLGELQALIKSGSVITSVNSTNDVKMAKMVKTALTVKTAKMAKMVKTVRMAKMVKMVLTAKTVNTIILT